MERKADVVVIGAGPAGLAAGVAAADQGASVLILERDERAGGILRQCIHNGFGLHYFGEELTGPEYAARFIEQAEKRGAGMGRSSASFGAAGQSPATIEILSDTMALSLSPERIVTAVNGRDGEITVRAGAVVLAMGCRERTRGALGIAGTRPAGIYTAGAAQRLVNLEGYLPGRELVILGSGDIGLIMARRMTWEGASVKMVCELMPYSSGLNRNIVQCVRDYDIPLYFSTTVTRVHGRERVEGVTIADVDENRRPIPETERFVSCDTLLLSVGLLPENELTRGAGAEIDPVTGGAVVDERRQTSLPGVFACGNALQVHDLVDHVSREAETAGRYAAEFAASKTLLQSSRGADRLNMGKTRVIGSGGTRYVVPQIISESPSETVDLFFRVGEVFKPARLTVTSGGNIIASRRKRVMTPGEMENITIRTDQINGEINVHTQADAQ